jgi:hypothetical protein
LDYLTVISQLHKGKGKGKGKVIPVFFNRASLHEGVLGDWMHSPTHS